MTCSKYILPLLLFCFLFVCCNKKTSPTDNTTDQNNKKPIKGEDSKVNSPSLKGSWTAISFPYLGKAFVPKVAYTVEFGKEGFGIALEINKCGTSCEYSDSMITFKETMSCTEACCDSKEGQTLSNLFRGNLNYTISQNILSITCPSGVIRLKKGDKFGLSGSQWIAQSYAGRKDGKVVKFSKQYVLSFEKAKVQLRLDVNNCTTSCQYLNRESAFELPTSNMGCSRKCCDSKDGELLMQSLQGKISYKMDGSNLVLKTYNKTIIFSPYKNTGKD